MFGFEGPPITLVKNEGVAHEWYITDTSHQTLQSRHLHPPRLLEIEREPQVFFVVVQVINQSINQSIFNY